MTAAPGGSQRKVESSRVLVAGALALIVAGLVLRGWVLSRGSFYWDDFILIGRAAEFPLFSADLLFHDHDGHFMPLTFAAAWLLTAVAPLEWWAAAASLLILQLLASLAVLRLLVVLLGWRPVLYVPLTFFLLSPLTLPAFAWWAAGLNALPLQAALAWVTADTVRLIETRRRRYAVSALVVFLIALLFFEKAAVVPFAAFAVALLWVWVAQKPREAGASRANLFAFVARGGRELWIGSAVVLLWWIPVYSMAVSRDVGFDGLESAGTILNRTFTDSLIPTLFGGPWTWERWLPSTPWAAAPQWATVVGWAALAAIVGGSIVLKRHVIPVFAFVFAYILLATIPVLILRAGPDTAPELVQSLRYLAETSVIIAAAIALVLIAPRRKGLDVRWHPGRKAAAVAVAAFTFSSVWSTVTFSQVWSENPSREYLANLRGATATDAPVQLLDQEVPWNLLSPVTFPQNMASRVLAPLDDRVQFGPVVSELRMVDDRGRLVAAEVWWNRAIPQGPDPECGYRISPAAPVAVPLGGGMFEHGWTAQLNYFSNAPGELTVAFDSIAGERSAVSVPIEEGLNTAYVRLVGGAESLLFTTPTPGIEICLGSGPVGVAAHAGN
ncbi:hypothetical protein [Hoyosella altamirensis]|uniref:Glycosyltransferase RgtA/B/C/D-like domain-containing protein n=1 Tax=Hoyosella altamirensis TaxID=616997 RepID=A0A839RRH9_9ACTN|nr:hypothetical protein [Hoyosella altamirensis]MBB3038706.1 hypothetical protein [Hoyosella altamirensis]